MTQDQATAAIIAAAARADRFGWVPGTAGNFSVRLDAEHCVITQSGRHKGSLCAADLMVVKLDGSWEGSGKPSFETGLHLALYCRDPAIGAVAHGHSVPATVLSMAAGEAIAITGYELQKIFEGYPDPASTLHLPVFDNDQNIPRLAAVIDAAMDASAFTMGYLIRGHGVYVWGADMGQAMARLEALEFILACELERSRRTAP